MEAGESEIRKTAAASSNPIQMSLRDLRGLDVQCADIKAD